MKRQAGFFLILSVFLIVIIGFAALIITNFFIQRNNITVAQYNGLQTFYNAESGLEIAARLLTNPTINTGNPYTRLACTTLSNSSTTNLSLFNGVLSLAGVNTIPYRINTTLSGSIQANTTAISLSSTTGLASAGRILVDREAIDYGSISGNQLVVTKRGASNTTAAAHANGAGVSEFQCNIDATANSPTATGAYRRELQAYVPLQEGWLVGNANSGYYTLDRYNSPTELSVTNYAFSGNSNLNSVSMLSNADAWAVGDANGFNHTILHWTGSSWQPYSLSACSNQKLNHVHMVSSQEGWAVGTSYNILCLGLIYRYMVLYYNGSSWNYLSSTTSPSIPGDSSLLSGVALNGVHAIDTNGDGKAELGFIVGNSGLILSYNGSSWSKITSPTSQTLNSVFLVSNKEAWAVGNNGTILRWNGSTWSTFTSPTSTTLNNVYMLDTNNDGLADVGWIVGNNGLYLTYNGSSFSSSTLGSVNLNDVKGFNANDVWVVGDSAKLYRWDGIAWENYTLFNTQNLNALDLTGPQIQPLIGWQQVF